MTSDKKNVSLLVDIFIKKGLSDIIISPGSRNAPIVIAFAGKKQISARSIIDERSAAFYALGLAQQKKKAVALACTSGTALLNYAPAIAEAYYQKIPLLILSADRPPELIDQGDGQTIRQKDVYRNYIKKSFELPVVIDDPATRQIAEQVVNTAIDQTLFPEPGPVHINIPFREPLYQTMEKDIEGNVFSTVKSSDELSDKEMIELAAEWNAHPKKLIIAGQMDHDPALNTRLAALAKLNDVVILTETTSNLHDPNFIDTIDNVVSSFSEQEEKAYKPDLLISIGGQVVSKMVKKYLRLNPARSHWHFSPSGEDTDTYFILSRVLTARPSDFFKRLAPNIQVGDEPYSSHWIKKRDQLVTLRDDYLSKLPFSDFKVFRTSFHSSRSFSRQDIPGKRIRSR
ncbi:MAG: 2-succinyl-5-enolpyruvyl-6-hydroxy-3-cyclohexene-1-carboxylic-acid synthase [bacterium]